MNVEPGDAPRSKHEWLGQCASVETGIGHAEWRKFGGSGGDATRDLSTPTSVASDNDTMGER